MVYASTGILAICHPRVARTVMRSVSNALVLWHEVSCPVEQRQKGLSLTSTVLAISRGPQMIHTRHGSIHRLCTISLRNPWELHLVSLKGALFLL
jgi:hypothetical protein